MFHFRQFAAPAIVGAALFIGGCSHDRHEDIPLSATEMGESKGQTFFSAPYDGRVYVYDATRNEMIYNGELKRGQMVKVDPKKNKVLVDNQTAVEKDLVDDHRYKIFFDKDEAAAAREAIPPQTTIVTPGSGARTTVETSPNSGTRVTTPDATITTDPNSQRTTVQPR